MAATMTQTLASAPIPLRRTTVTLTISHPRPWVRIAWFALAVALLVAMIPGLAHVPSPAGFPGQLAAPVVIAVDGGAATNGAPDTTTDTVDPTPQPAGA
jgi:hypothetical protein